MDLGTSSPKRRGFTFIEVMFAVLILGFGVIMIAAMLPVAVRETSRTRETAAGNSTVESGFHALEAVWEIDTLATPTPPAFIDRSAATVNSALPVYGDFVAQTYPEAFVPFDADYGTAANTDVLPGLFHRTLGNRIDSRDATSAWIPFYARGGSAGAPGVPKLAVVGVRARNVDTIPPGYFLNPDNCPLPVVITMREGSQYVGTNIEELAVDRFEFEMPDSPPGGYTENQLVQALCEGAAVVTVNQQRELRVYRLAKAVDDDATGLNWTLAAGGDMRGVLDAGGKPVFGSEVRVDDIAPAARNPIAVSAYLVGRVLRDPTAAWDETDNPYVGPSQVSQSIDGQPLPR